MGYIKRVVGLVLLVNLVSSAPSQEDSAEATSLQESSKQAEKAIFIAVELKTLLTSFAKHSNKFCDADSDEPWLDILDDILDEIDDDTLEAICRILCSST